ncbi:MAG TPA: cytochrome P460 family protein [Kofleriaceae bacterium]|nr:cytochrome P460 family protein [Kofleriaceae bacterium]
MKAALALAAAAGALAACGEAADVPPLGDYTQWHRHDLRGPTPGHGDDTYRIVYVNDAAAEDPSNSGAFADGATLVKEVHDDDDGQPGALRELAIMRRLGPPPPTLTGTGGWVFTLADDPGEPASGETRHDSCWSSCHVAAPYLGVWGNYDQPGP